jgi:uncharacterized protein (DUF433 family)/DNA-binding transcriptional MerR regulator
MSEPARRQRSEPFGHYGPTEVARLAGVTPERVGQWARRGLIRPSRGGSPHVYSLADAAEALVAHYLVAVAGLSPREVRGVVGQLREHFGDWPLTAAPLQHEGRLVVVREEGGAYLDVRHPGASVMGDGLIDLSAVRASLAHGGWVALESERPLIGVDPGHAGGRPVLAGTRLPTAQVAAMAADGDRALLREQFGLSEAQIDAAVEFERDASELVAGRRS